MDYDTNKLALEMADMAERAALEIRSLQQRNSNLQHDAEAYQVLCKAINGLTPQVSQSYSEDFAYRLTARAQSLREEFGEAESPFVVQANTAP